MVYKYSKEANVMSVVEADYLYKHGAGRAGNWDMDVVDGSVVNLILIFVPNFIGARGCLPSWVHDVGRKQVVPNNMSFFSWDLLLCPAIFFIKKTYRAACPDAQLALTCLLHV